jgi:hypothetical protein
MRAEIAKFVLRKHSKPSELKIVKKDFSYATTLIENKPKYSLKTNANGTFLVVNPAGNLALARSKEEGNVPTTESKKYINNATEKTKAAKAKAEAKRVANAKAAENARKAEEAEKARKAKEAEEARKAKEAEEARKAKEAKRLANAEAKRLANAKEAKRLANAKEAKRLANAEAKRLANAKEEAARAKLTAEANALKESILKVSRLKSANKQGNRNYPSELVRQNLASYTGVKNALQTHQDSYNAIVEERRKRLAKSFNIKQMFKPNHNKIDKLIKKVKNAQNESKVKTEIVEALNKYKNDAKSVIKDLKPLIPSLSTGAEKDLVKEYIANPAEDTKKAALGGIVGDSLRRGPAKKRQKIYSLLGGNPEPPIEFAEPIEEMPNNTKENKPRKFAGSIKPELKVYRGK